MLVGIVYCKFVLNKLRLEQNEWVILLEAGSEDVPALGSKVLKVLRHDSARNWHASGL